MILFKHANLKRSSLRALSSAVAVLTLSAMTACAPAPSAVIANPSENVAAFDDSGLEGSEPVVPASPALLKELAQFSEPVISENDMSSALSKYNYVNINGEVPQGLMSKALAYYEANKSHLGNTKYLSVVDFGKNSSQARFFIVNMSTGSVWTIHVAHGSGSDRNNDGLADVFSNVNGSNASSLGYYRTAETYSGNHGYSLRLDGLSSTNSNVRARAIVVHGSDYVSEVDKRQGRSWGCLAVQMSLRTKLIDMIKGGSLIYASN